MNTANRTKLGVFVLLGVFLLVGSFLAVGVATILEPRIRAMTALDTSVEGLSVGSQVKYLGVSVGRVTRLAMRRGDGQIAVYFDIFPAAMDQAHDDPASADADLLHSRNLQCFVNASGLMGGAYLELSTIRDHAQGPALSPVKLPAGTVYIRSVPSHIGNAIQNASRVVDSLSKVDWIQLSDKVNLALQNVNTVFGNGELAETLKNFGEISRQLEGASQRLAQLLSAENMSKLNRSIENVDEALVDLRRLQVRETLDNINVFLNETRTFLASTEGRMKNAGSAATELRIRMEETLTRMDNFSVEITRMLGAIEDQPEQLLRGRK